MCTPALGFSAATILVAMAVSVSAAVAEETKPAELQPPKDNWQKPGEIQQPKGTWQVPGEIQKPGDIQRIEERCQHRLVLAADTLFAFDQATLTTEAEKTLAALGPQLAAEKGAITVAGHTDAIGGEEYNRELSERRARAVRDWLAGHRYLPAATPIIGYGKAQPVAPNTKPDGSDDPAGRQKNRRVEVVVETCPEAK